MNKHSVFLFFLFSFASISAMSLREACFRNDVTRVRTILTEDSNALNQDRDKEGFLPIHNAAYGGSINVLLLLLDTKSALINATDARGNVPFVHIFLGIDTLRGIIKKETIVRNLEKLGILKRMGPSLAELEQKEREMFENFRKAIDLFISRGANLDVANNFGAKWFDMPGLDKEFAAYARRQLGLSKTGAQK